METGLTYTSTVTVSEENIAATMGSGDLEVFATPAMVALMENAAMNAVVGELPEGATTVGAMMNTTHIKPSAMGDTVSATAVLKEVEGRKLTFEVHAKDSKGVIGEGMHVRTFLKLSVALNIGEESVNVQMYVYRFFTYL